MNSGRNGQHPAPLSPALDLLDVRLQRESPKEPGMCLMFSCWVQSSTFNILHFLKLVFSLTERMTDSPPAQHPLWGQSRPHPTRHLILVSHVWEALHRHRHLFVIYWNLKFNDLNILFYDDVAAKLTTVPKVPVPTSIDSTGSGGKRKRKIQLVPSHRDDQISLVRSDILPNYKLP